MKLRPDVPLPPRKINTATSTNVITPQPVSAYHELPLAFQKIIQRAWTRQHRNALSARSAATKAGIGLSTLWRDLKLGLFVSPISISTRRTAFLDFEIDALLEAKTLLSRSNLKVDLRVFIAALTQPSHN